MIHNNLKNRCRESKCIAFHTTDICYKKRPSFVRMNIWKWYPPIFFSPRNFRCISTKGTWGTIQFLFHSRPLFVGYLVRAKKSWNLSIMNNFSLKKKIQLTYLHIGNNPNTWKNNIFRLSLLPFFSTFTCNHLADALIQSDLQNLYTVDLYRFIT